MEKRISVTGRIIYISMLLCISIALFEPEWITFPGGSGTPGENI
ncbi:MAG: hypothetical protein ACUVWP_05245 [bacterium]